MKFDNRFIKRLIRRMADECIGASGFWGQPEGTIKIIRKYLAKIKLNEFNNISELSFNKKLDYYTERIKHLIEKKSWGISRKGLNLFLYHCSQNFILRKKFNLKKIVPYLELVLDNKNAKNLMKINTNYHLGYELFWHSIQEHKKENNPNFQMLAKIISENPQRFGQHFRKCERCYIDVYWWRG